MPSAVTVFFRRVGAVFLMVNVFVVVYFLSLPSEYLKTPSKSLTFTEDHHERLQALEEKMAELEKKKAKNLEVKQLKEWDHFLRVKFPVKPERSAVGSASKTSNTDDEQIKAESESHREINRPSVGDEDIVVSKGKVLEKDAPVQKWEDFEDMQIQMNLKQKIALHKAAERSRENVESDQSIIKVDSSEAGITVADKALNSLKLRPPVTTDKEISAGKVVSAAQEPMRTTMNPATKIIKIKKKKAKKKKKKKKAKPEKPLKAAKLILIYTQLHGHDEWYNLKYSMLEGYTDNVGCAVTNCQITYDKSLLPKAAAVVFHDRDMPSPAELYSLTKTVRPWKQRWIFFTAETPKNTEHSLLPYNDLFNWTMSYKLASDIVVPYLQYRPLAENDPRPPRKNYAKGKTRQIAWLISNCKFGLRMEVARVLQSYSDLYVGGQCRDTFSLMMNCSRRCDEKELQNYKFFLAMENGVCTDYITEKYWYYLEKDLVPIVMGGADYKNPRLAIPNSFINIADYRSLEELGKYLNMLDRNDEKYNEYFEWKQYYKVWHPPAGDWPFESFWICRLCEMLHDESLPVKVYSKLSDFWDEQTDCELPERQLTNQLFPKDYDWDHESDEELERLKKAYIPKEFDEM